MDRENINQETREDVAPEEFLDKLPDVTPEGETPNSEEESGNAISMTLDELVDVVVRQAVKQQEEIRETLVSAVRNPMAMAQTPFVLITKPDANSQEELMCAPPEELFPEEKDKAEIEALKELNSALREVTGRELVFGLDNDSTGCCSTEIVLQTIYLTSHNFLDVVSSGLGTFSIIELCRENEPEVYARRFPEIPSGALEVLGLHHCATSLNADGLLEPAWVQHSKIHFPPQKPWFYINGSEAQKDAAEFWRLFYNGTILGLDCPEAALLRSFLGAEDRKLQLYEDDLPSEPETSSEYSGSIGTIVTEMVVGNIGNIDLSKLFSTGRQSDAVPLRSVEQGDEEIQSIVRMPKKVLRGKEAQKWISDALDRALARYEFEEHAHEFVFREEAVN